MFISLLVRYLSVYGYFILVMLYFLYVCIVLVGLLVGVKVTLIEDDIVLVFWKFFDGLEIVVTRYIILYAFRKVWIVGEW